MSIVESQLSKWDKWVGRLRKTLDNVKRGEGQIARKMEAQHQYKIRLLIIILHCNWIE